MDLLVFPANLENEFNAEEKVSSAGLMRPPFFLCGSLGNKTKPAADGRVLMVRRRCLPQLSLLILRAGFWLPAPFRCVRHSANEREGLYLAQCLYHSSRRIKIRRCPLHLAGVGAWTSLSEKEGSAAGVYVGRILRTGPCCPPCSERTPHYPCLPARWAGPGRGGAGVVCLCAFGKTAVCWHRKASVKHGQASLPPASWSSMQNNTCSIVLAVPSHHMFTSPCLPPTRSPAAFHQPPLSHCQNKGAGGCAGVGQYTNDRPISQSSGTLFFHLPPQRRRATHLVRIHSTWNEKHFRRGRLENH